MQDDALGHAQFKKHSPTNCYCWECQEAYHSHQEENEKQYETIL